MSQPLDQPLDLPKLSQPAHRALAAAGYTQLSQFTSVTEQELLKLHGLGPKSIRELRAALAERGLAFAPAPKSNSLQQP